MKKNLRFALLVASMPLILLTAIWILTFGSFDYIRVIHSEPHIVFTAFFTMLGTIAFFASSQSDL